MTNASQKALLFLPGASAVHRRPNIVASGLQSSMVCVCKIQDYDVPGEAGLRMPHSHCHEMIATVPRMEQSAAIASGPHLQSGKGQHTQSHRLAQANALDRKSVV